ncbi:MAG: hypothetical protein WC869_15665 [Phycisphaerae bacterium]
MSVFTAFQLLSVPVFVRQLGVPLYGDWIVLYAVPSYLSLADFGVQTSAGSAMAMCVGAGEIAEAAGILRAFRRLIVTVAAALVALLVAGCLALSPVRILGLDAIGLRDARLAILLLALYAALNLYWGVYSIAFRSIGLFHRHMWAITIVRAIEFAGIIGCLAMGAGPVDLAAVLLVIRVVGTLAVQRDYMRSAPWHTVVEPRPFRLGSLVTSSLANAGISAATLVQNQGMLLVASAVGGPGQVVALNSIRTVTNSLYHLATLSSAGVTPELSRALGANDRALALRLFRTLFAVVCAVSVAAAVAMCALGPLFLRLWTDGAVSVSFVVMWVFVVSTATDCTWLAALSIASAANRTQGIAIAYFAAAVVAVPVAYQLLPHLGIIGVGFSLLTTSVAVNAVALPVAVALAGDTLASLLGGSPVEITRLVRRLVKRRPRPGAVGLANPAAAASAADSARSGDE